MTSPTRRRVTEGAGNRDPLNIYRHVPKIMLSLIGFDKLFRGNLKHLFFKISNKDHRICFCLGRDQAFVGWDSFSVQLIE